VTIEIGQVIDEKYRIVRKLGEGGMGAVYEGENTRIKRRVAIKVLSAAHATSLELIARFEREAQAAGQIGNDHILEVLDLGTLPNGFRYMVLEYLDGETLLDRINALRRLTPEQLVPLARQFLSALDAAHAAGIIHRDLKPENIFILREKAGRPDFVKLIDFGISKFANLPPDAYRVTREGSLIGTPSYMAPEQARGIGEADVRSDIYAVGVILYEAVTGKLPFDGFASFHDLLFKIALSDPPPPSKHLATLDPAFERIIMKAMARERTDRYETVQDLNDALEDWATERNVPLSVQPPRTPRRMSIPEERDSGKRLPAETQMETVTALPIPIYDEENGRMVGTEPTLQDQVPAAASSEPELVIPPPRALNKVVVIAVAAGLFVTIAVGVGVAVAASRSTPKAIGMTAATGAPSETSPTHEPPPATTITPLVEAGAAEPEPDTTPQASASAKKKPPVKPIASARGKGPAAAGAGAGAGAAPKGTAKPDKPSGTDFGY
jgi:eukaryotic-like serine/threonine-protein kinase